MSACRPREQCRRRAVSPPSPACPQSHAAQGRDDGTAFSNRRERLSRSCSYRVYSAVEVSPSPVKTAERGVCLLRAAGCAKSSPYIHTYGIRGRLAMVGCLHKSYTFVHKVSTSLPTSSVLAPGVLTPHRQTRWLGYSFVGQRQQTPRPPSLALTGPHWPSLALQRWPQHDAPTQAARWSNMSPPRLHVPELDE